MLPPPSAPPNKVAIPHTLFLADDAATATLGAQLAQLLRDDDLVLLHGDLGVGKTALARAIIRTMLDDPETDVPSPSFALVQPYESETQTILHADLYRLDDEGDIDELGILDADGAIVLVEWPDRAPMLSHLATLRIDLALGPNNQGRTASISFTDPKRQTAAIAKLSASDN